MLDIQSEINKVIKTNIITSKVIIVKQKLLELVYILFTFIINSSLSVSVRVTYTPRL